MSPAALPSARTASRKRPAHGFAKGAALGLVVVIPLVSLGIWAGSRLGIGAARPSMIEIVRLVVVFAGLPALVTAGGIGRLAAQASLEGGRNRAAWVAARALAFGGMALLVLGAIPTGTLPVSQPGWIALAAVGLVLGAMGGALIGLACGGEMPSLVELGVWPPDGSMGRTFDRVVGKRRGETTAPPDEPADRR